MGIGGRFGMQDTCLLLSVIAICAIPLWDENEDKGGCG
jgi:hypothetical protein